jgi:hypothetical protein
VAISYGDLNADAGLGELDSGTDVMARRRRLQSRCGWSRILTSVACKKRWMWAALATGVRISQVRCSADDEDR